MLLFFQLYLAHLVADFLLQPDWVARRKTEVRPLSAHAATHLVCAAAAVNLGLDRRVAGAIVAVALIHTRSEEHTSELQSRLHLVCRLLLEKKKERPTSSPYSTIIAA